MHQTLAALSSVKPNFIDLGQCDFGGHGAQSFATAVVLVGGRRCHKLVKPVLRTIFQCAQSVMHQCCSCVLRKYTPVTKGERLSAPSAAGLGQNGRIYRQLQSRDWLLVRDGDQLRLIKSTGAALLDVAKEFVSPETI